MTARTSGFGYAFKKYRIEHLQFLHRCIDYLIEPKAELVEAGLSCNTDDGQRFLIHLQAAYYVADMLEAEDLLCVKRSNQTSKPYHLCKAN